MLRCLALLCGLAAAAAVAAPAAPPLPAYGAQAGGVTVSGISSGGYMAVQFHVAHSESVDGAGVLAAGPYYCAQGSMWRALRNCMTPGRRSPVPEPVYLRAVTNALAEKGAIDSTRGLAQDRVWLFSGTHDETVAPAVVDALEHFYRLYLPAAGIARVKDVPAGHGMVTGAGGPTDEACQATQGPYLNPCGYDAAGALLAHLYGARPRPAREPTGRLLAFDQRPFAQGDAHALSLADTGFLYVPAACERAACRVHVAFHGCRQSAESIGERFVREAGYDRWADALQLLVLYPQTRPRYGPTVFNPNGCWDWWGYSGPDYHTQRGPQVRAVKAMVERLTAPRASAR